jgi:hypothetical protein
MSTAADQRARNTQSEIQLKRRMLGDGGTVTFENMTTMRATERVTIGATPAGDSQP